MGVLKLRKREVSDYRGCAVLIYSKDPSFGDYYRKIFVSMGLTPLTENTPEAASGILRLTKLAFVVVDQDGTLFGCRRVLQQAREMRQQGPVVVAARKPDRNFRDEALALGAADYLGHPAPPDDILRVLLAGNNHSQKAAHHTGW